MSFEDRVKEYLKRLEFRSRIVIALFIVLVIVFLAVWATIRFTLPAFVTDPKLIEKSVLFIFWTIGAILFGIALAAFIVHRQLRNALRAK